MWNVPVWFRMPIKNQQLPFYLTENYVAVISKCFKIQKKPNKQNVNTLWFYRNHLDSNRVHFSAFGGIFMPLLQRVERDGKKWRLKMQQKVPSCSQTWGGAVHAGVLTPMARGHPGSYTFDYFCYYLLHKVLVVAELIPWPADLWLLNCSQCQELKLI